MAQRSGTVEMAGVVDLESRHDRPRSIARRSHMLDDAGLFRVRFFRWCFSLLDALHDCTALSQALILGAGLRGMLSTRVALAIGFILYVARVEPGRKLQLPLGLLLR